ncbi:MAG: hypothetical protein QM784_08580 [Polyangiaceae bacterium]
MKPISMFVVGLAGVALTHLAWAEDTSAGRLVAVPQSRAVGNSLTVLDENVVVTCRATGTHLRCSSLGQLVVLNPTGAALSMTLEVDETATTLTIDGRVVPLHIPEGQRVKAGEVTLPSGKSRIVVAQPRAFEREAGARAAEVISSVIVTRHPQLGRSPGRPLGAELSLQSIGVTRRWKSVQNTRLTVEFPSNWQLQPEFADCGEAPIPANGCVRAKTADSDVALWHVESTETASPLSTLVTLSPKSGPLSNGGVLVGLGWGGGDGCLGCTEALRVRAGYEMGLRSWGILGLVGEFSTGTTKVLVPSLDYAAFPYLGGWVPAVSVGMGLPVLLTSEGGGGMRWQMSGTWPVDSFCSVGMQLHLDAIMTPRGTEPRGALSLQVGL